jgi:uncharacterized SAM-dependent methyltransferase
MIVSPLRPDYKKYVDLGGVTVQIKLNLLQHINYENIDFRH